MCIILSFKIQVSSMIITRFRQGNGVILLPLLPQPQSEPQKEPQKVRVKILESQKNFRFCSSLCYYIFLARITVLVSYLIILLYIFILYYLMLSYFFPCSFYASFNFPTFYNHFELTLPRCLLSCASTWRIEAKKDVLGNVNSA